jgi:RNA polymerase sigma-70 factor (ECF subfamily)
MGPTVESELIQRCRRGDARAWDEFFDLHYSAAGRFVFQLSHDFSWEDVEEICQDAFLSIIKNIHSFKGNCRIQTWVFHIAANKARDYRQRRLAAKRGGGQTVIPLQSALTDDGAKIDPPAPAPGPDAVLMNSERAALLQAALAQLGDPCREIIELRYFGDLSYEEISDALELNPKTVSSRLSKCLDRLEAVAKSVFSGAKLTATPSNQ